MMYWLLLIDCNYQYNLSKIYQMVYHNALDVYQ